MKTRVISALVALPILVWILITGGVYLYGACLVLSLIGLFEFFQAFRNKGIRALYIAGYALTGLYYALLWWQPVFQTLGLWLFLAIACLMGIYIFSKKHTAPDVAVTLWGILYVGFFMSHIFLVSQLGDAFYLWLIFIFAWVTDTCAYFTGYFFGKHPLIPSVSPKKTVEGAVGGVVGTVLVVAILSYFLKPEFLFFGLPIAALGAMLSQLGDLMASKIKRYVAIKDYGHLMPGHGGVLDRFDSILMTAPFVYYMVQVYQAIQTVGY